MTSDDLTREQLEKLQATVGRYLRFLNRLCDRMTRLGFTNDDPLYRAAQEAMDGVHSLSVAAHYASCEGGIGRQRSATSHREQ